MSVINNNLLLTAAAGATGYQVSRSLRFDGGSYLSRTPGSAGSRTTWTWSGWIKRSALGSQQTFFDGYSDGSNRTQLMFESDNAIRILNLVGGSVTTNLITTAVFRDASAWYHVVIAWDTTQGTSSNRVKVYINGTQQTTFSTATYPGSSENSFINAVNAHDIGRTGAFAEAYFNGYLAECHFIDGSAKVPGDFAETDATTGQWVPKLFSGSYGSQGWKLTFADNSNNTASTLGKDTSGNSPANNWTPNNIQNAVATGNYSTTPSGGYRGDGQECFRPNQYLEASSDGDVTFTVNNVPTATSTMVVVASTPVGVGNGAYNSYFQINGVNYGTQLQSTLTYITVPGGSLSTLRLKDVAGTFAPRVYSIIRDGVYLYLPPYAGAGDSLVDSPTSYGTDTGVGNEVRGNYCTWNPIDSDSGGTLSNGNLDWTSGGAGHDNVRGTFFPQSGKWYWEVTIPTITAGTGAVQVGIANPSATLTGSGTNSNTYIYANNGDMYGLGSLAGTNSSFTGGDIIGMAYNRDANTLTFYKNGTVQSVSYSSISTTTQWAPFVNLYGPQVSGAAVANFGQRAFARSGGAPSGFKALCDTNLTAPVVAKPSTVMDALLYTGNGGTQTVSGLSFSPDLVWTKARSAANSHALWDTVRGVEKRLMSNATDAEASRVGGLTAFTSSGFTHGNDGTGNDSGTTYVAWAWDAGTTTSSNGSGSITSSCRTNQSSGFSVISYTANGTAGATIGHSLNVAPQFLIVKNRSGSQNWFAYHASVGATKGFNFNETGAAITDSGYWNNTAPTSTLITLGNYHGYFGSANFICYAWAPVAGYSSMGSYVGNGSSDGVFQWCGFRPRWIMIKSSTLADGWQLFDTARGSYNVIRELLEANNSGAENTALDEIDVLSNGFKQRNTRNALNASGQTYVWVAFAESPFQYARAR